VLGGAGTQAQRADMQRDFQSDVARHVCLLPYVGGDRAPTFDTMFKPNPLALPVFYKDLDGTGTSDYEVHPALMRECGLNARATSRMRACARNHTRGMWYDACGMPRFTPSVALAFVR
jgi:hypothetical protein